MAVEQLQEKEYGQLLADSGTYVLMGDIDFSSTQSVIQWILFMNNVSRSKKRELNLVICSDGGLLQPAFALIDIMNGSKIPIRTIGIGQIASCSLMIFMNGAKGRRTITPNTSILSHQFSWSNEGKSSELFATIREYELTQQRMIDHYKHCTNQTDEIIKSKLLPSTDIWLSTEEALQLNICDSVCHLDKL
jgi:ATP-dependent Clp protease protease subunit